MPDPKMPDRSVPAANADVLGEDARTSGAVDGPDANTRGRPSPGERVADGRGQARPGKDENQAGFLKEKDEPGKV